MTPRPIIVSHSGCPDGSFSAAVAYLKYGEKADYTRASYDYGAPPVLAGRDVTIIDFSFKPPVMEEIFGVARSVTVIDHHETSINTFANSPLRKRGTWILDESMCGAMLAWEHFFPKKEIPEPILYANDRDLWRHDLPHSREINVYFESLGIRGPFKTALGILLHWDAKKKREAVDAGELILPYQQQLVASALAHKEFVEIEGHKAWAVNTCMLPSEIGEALALIDGGEFGVVYHWNARIKRFNFNLRSRGSFNVAALAEIFGGGGHAKAAGFSVARLPWK